jgi:hypothetical protein
MAELPVWAINSTGPPREVLQYTPKSGLESFVDSVSPPQVVSESRPSGHHVFGPFRLFRKLVAYISSLNEGTV